ncbi:MAG: segregation/condensation protein A [Promicromonosporaceae bacterium]|nr:segregation/condensation protein A [Promicromonosporaceae bacterium]
MGETGAGAFELRLENFTGPFDLLLSLIAKHELDVTEVALATVTDEFVSYIHQTSDWDLDTASEFLVIAATLLDLKATRLLPGADREDSEDLEALEARDLLFAKLLQYKAYKEITQVFAAAMEAEGRRHPRSAALEPEQAALLPDLVWTLTPAQFAALAATALEPKATPLVSLSHLHAPVVSVREQAGLVMGELRRARTLTFRALTSGQETPVIIARFLALLELFRTGQVAFEQAAALRELTVRWTGQSNPGQAAGPHEGSLEIEEYAVAASPEYETTGVEND